MVILAKILFEKAQSVLTECHKLFNRSQETEETLESFYAALTAQVLRSDFFILEDESLRYLFISKMKIQNYKIN